MALRGPSSHGSTSSSTPTPDMRSTGFENRASSAATIRSHMHASIRPAAEHVPCTAAIVELAEVADLHELVEVHDLLVAQLALGRGAHRRPVLLAREQLLQVVAGREVLALGGEHDDPDVVVGVGAVERGVELVDQLAVLRVGGAGPVQRDRGDRAVDRIPDRGARHPRRRRWSRARMVADWCAPDPLTSSADVPKRKEMSIRPVPELPDAARAVGALIAPVVACLRGDDEGVRILLDDTCESGRRRDGRAAPRPRSCASTSASRRRPTAPTDIVREFPDAAIERFGDRELVTLGVECLHVARVPEPVESIARAVFVDDAMAHGDRHALEGAIATCWWCALQSARLRDVDPIAEAAAICRYVARVA